MTRIYLTEILLFVNDSFQKKISKQKDIMPEIVSEMILYIQANLTEELSLEQLSKVFYHNGAYLSRIFKKHTGLTLREYILDQRVEAAKRILSKGKSVSEVCYASGFSDYANFIRSFKKVTGISPGHWGKSEK